MIRPLISFRNLLITLLLAVSALGQATTITSATKIVGPDGQPFNGTLTLQLPFAGVNTVTNQLVLATPISVAVVNGVIAQPFAVPGNDTMSPAMPYSALYSDSFGTPITRQFYYILGATFDVGSAPATPNFLNTQQIPVFNGTVFLSGAIGNGVVDDTLAIQSAMLLAGSPTSPPTNQVPFGTLVGTHNAQQGTVVFPPNKVFKITSAIEIPPGVRVDLNGSTVLQTTAGQDALRYTNNNAGGYGVWFADVKNGVILGPGSGVSTGRGLFLGVVNVGHFSNLRVSGFKFGCVLWEVQYTTFDTLNCSNNVVGWYVTAQPTQQNLTSIDNYFYNIVGDVNTKYGIWCQSCTSSSFDRVDSGRNGSVDILIGSQLVKYISSYTVTNGGSGYAINSTIPATITDVGGGTMAQAYAVTNGSGVVTGVFGVDGGANYVTPVVSIPGGGVAATVTANVTDDTGLGDWNGVSGVSRGNLVFNNVKVEHGPDRPNSGYGVILTDNVMRNITFNNLQVAREPGGQTPYMRWLRNGGFGTYINYPADSSGFPDSLSNPAVSGDVSIFRQLNATPLVIRWGSFVNADTSQFKYVVNASGTVDYGGFTQASDGFTTDGKKLATGYEAQSNVDVPVFNARINGETNASFTITARGSHLWGAGGASALDSGLCRAAANTLQAGNTAGTCDASGTFKAARFGLGAGNATNPSLFFSANPTDGFHQSLGAGTSLLSLAGLNQIVWGTALQRMKSTTILGMSSATDPATAQSDVNLSRPAAGVYQVGTGETANALGEIRSAKISATYNAAGTVQTAVHIVQDTCTLGTSCAVTLTGSAAFTNATSYTCVAEDQTAIAATRAVQASGSSVTFTGTGTDVLRYTCIGN